MSAPSAGTVNPLSIFTTRSGVPSCQPSVNFGNAGVFAGSPLAMPCFTQVLDRLEFVIGEAPGIFVGVGGGFGLPGRHNARRRDCGDELAVFGNIVVI